MRKTFRNKNFIKKVLVIAFPIMLEQLLISSFGIVDTLMVKNIFRGIAGVGLGAQIGTSSGIVMFAFATGVGMYLAQYFGDEDTENVKNSFSLLIILGFAVAFFFFILGFAFPRQILMLFSTDEQVLDIATGYLRIASFAYFGNLLSYAYVIAYRNVQKPVVSLIMQTTFAALNVLLNYLLIFGIGIFPKMGIEGAALATVISSTLSLVAHIIYAKMSKQIFVPKLNNYKVALTRTFNKAILKRSLPLFINESMFSLGTLIYIAIFNKLGPDAYEGYKIADTVVTLWFSISFGMNAAVTAMTGAQLGKGDTQTAKEYGDGFLWIGLLLSVIIGAIVVVLAKPSVMLFNSSEVTSTTINIAISLMYVSALRIVLKFFSNVTLAVFRAGGLTKFVLLMDSAVMWVVGMPIAFIGYRYLHITNISLLFLLMQLEAVVRITISLIKYFKYDWLNNIIGKIIPRFDKKVLLRSAKN